MKINFVIFQSTTPTWCLAPSLSSSSTTTSWRCTSPSQMVSGVTSSGDIQSSQPVLALNSTFGSRTTWVRMSSIDSGSSWVAHSVDFCVPRSALLKNPYRLTALFIPSSIFWSSIAQLFVHSLYNTAEGSCVHWKSHAMEEAAAVRSTWRIHIAAERSVYLQHKLSFTWHSCAATLSRCWLH